MSVCYFKTANYCDTHYKDKESDRLFTADSIRSSKSRRNHCNREYSHNQTDYNRLTYPTARVEEESRDFIKENQSKLNSKRNNYLYDLKCSSYDEYRKKYIERESVRRIPSDFQLHPEESKVNNSAFNKNNYSYSQLSNSIEDIRDDYEKVKSRYYRRYNMIDKENAQFSDSSRLTPTNKSIPNYQSIYKSSQLNEFKWHDACKK